MANELVPYLSHDIDPDQKGSSWITAMAKTIWQEAQKGPDSMFYRAAAKYNEYRNYARGKQSVNKYKPLLNVDIASDASALNIDWNVRPIASKFRDIAIAKIIQNNFNIVATPIDALAKDEADKYFDNIKAKIALREAAKDINPALANTAALRLNPGEPENFEELEMQMNFGFKHNMAMEAEQGLALIHYQNDVTSQRFVCAENFFDLGVAGYKEWLDENGNVCYRACDPQNVGVSYCRKSDFSDKRWVFEIIEVEEEELIPYFGADKVKGLADNLGNKTNLYTFGNDFQYDRKKVRVMDLEFKTWDTMVFRRTVNDEGNIVVKRSKFRNKDNNDQININGETKSKYFSRKPEMIYKCKWVIGTDLIYDFGPAENMKRQKGDEAKTDFSYHFKAMNFYNMRAQGFMERLMPIIDEYQLTIFKVQSFKNKWIPYVIDIDLDALEEVAIGKGGENMTPKSLLDMMFQSHVLVGRRKDISNTNINYKAVEVRPTGMANEFSTLVADLTRLIQEMRDVIGMNEITDGTGPSPKMLKSVANMTYEATNNALYQMMYCDKCLMEQLSLACLQRLILAVKNGKVEGIIHALGTNTVKFIEVSPDIAFYKWGIKLEYVPDDDDIQTIMQQMNLGESQGLLQPEDIFLIKTCTNIKQMEMMLAYRVKKRKQEAQQNQIQQMQMNGQIQQQSAVAAEQEKQRTLQIEYQLKMQLEQVQHQNAMQQLALKMQGQQNAASIQAAAKQNAQNIASEAQKEKERIRMNKEAELPATGQYFGG